ncbi:MAG: OmpA family protein [Saprospiraceae bacterium]|nr:OmpA family protein [Saprospiraceae bacterium]
MLNEIHKIATKATSILLVFATCASALLSAQTNFLLNPGMEEPAHRQPKSWTPLGSVDYYQNGTLARTNFEGTTPKFPPPASGKNFVGIRAFDNATEILSGRLEKSMYKERWYRVSGKVRRPDADCNTPVFGIAFVLSDTLPKSDLWYGFDKTIPYLMLKPVQTSEAQYLISDYAWTEVVGYYQAKGGERFLWLGNFPGANAKEIGYDENWISSSTPEAEGLHCLYHYYYDDFSVTEALDPNTSMLTIRNVTFDAGSAAVTEVNEPEMKQLPALLHDFPAYTVEVTGHTDSDGKDAANLKLSQQRADAVKKWLSEHSIAPERIVATGKGETQPVVPNDTPENKAQNRRVEIRIRRE